MARGKYHESPELRALRELVEYAEETGPAAPKGMHMGGFPIYWMAAGDGLVTGETSAELLRLRGLDRDAAS